MYDAELDPNAPYDNVEFPVRKSGTGTWPGGGSTGGSLTGSGTSGGGGKLLGYQTTGRAGTGSKLAPLVEVDGQEGSENSRPPPTSLSTSSSMSANTPTGYGLGKPPTSPSSGNRSTSQTQSKSGGSSSSTAFSTPGITPLSSSSTPSTTSSAVVSQPSLLTNTASTKDKTGNSNTKPAVVVPNDSLTYVSTQINSSSDKKKTLKQVEVEEEDFKRQDLNPTARVALERVYTKHHDFYQLNSKVLDEGSLLKQDVLDIYRKSGETLTYEQLLQGMLVDGERFLLGSCWLYYTNVQFLDIEGIKSLRELFGRGRVGLTSKRALFLSTETFTDANLEQFDEPGKKSKEGYKLEVSKKSNVTFKNIPLSNFHSAEMEVTTGTAAQTKITKKEPCCGCFGFSSKTRWVSTPPMTRSINSRVLRVGVSMPPWQTRMFLDIHLDPSMSLTVARDFISQLHAFAPHMH